MPTLQYDFSSPPIGGVTVFVSRIFGSCEKVECVDIGNSNNIFNAPPTASSYGLNGTYFNMTTGNLTKMSRMNGMQVRAGGNANPRPSGTFIIYNQTVGPDQSALRTAVSFITNESDFTGGRVKMAVGGIDLRLSETFSDESSFHTKVLETDGAGYSVTERKHKTALVAFPDKYGPNHSDFAMVAVFSFAGNTPSNPDMQLETGGVNTWQLRELIRSTYPTAIGAIMLDGGGSTQIVAHVGSIRKGILTGNGSPMSARAVRTMIRTPWTW
jgi:hypothetical protein